VDQYKGIPQISLGRDSDLVALDGAIALAPQRRLGELSAQDVGDMALVEATIVRVDPFSAGVKFRLDDGTGLVTLLVWQELYESLTGRDALVAGTRVRILGEVAEYRGDLEIVPQIASDLAVLGSSGRDVERRALGELSEDDTGRTVAVQGILCSLQAFSAGVKGTLDDDTGTATLLLWQDLYEGLSDGSRLVPGAILEVQGEVNLYRGELEIVPQSPKNVTVVGLAELPSDRRAIEQVTSADVDQVIELVGRITGAVPFSKGIRYTLDDGTGTVTLLLWHDVYEQLADEALLSVGAEVGVHGKVAEYLGQLEIVPQMPGDIRVAAPVAGSTAQETPEAVASPAESPVATVTPGGKPPVVMTGTPTAGPTMGTPEVPPQPSPPPTPLPTATLPFETKDLGSITNDDIGRSLTVAKAGIVDVDYFSQGVKYRLEDGKGSIILLLWQNVLEEFSGRYDLVLGSQLQVTGRIDQFAGDLELVPRGGADIILLARGERLPLEERLARNVTASDEGRIFTVEGTVTRVEGSGWIKVWLADSTGEILIFVPERTVPYLPAGIGHGVRLRATGAVDIYQGTVEIIPLAGADVKKVEGP
jgi:DNA/RNA endonuclease YhcR with UshA esterase domain